MAGKDFGMDKLSERVEALSGPDREVDVLIEIAVIGYPERAYHQRNAMRRKGAPDIDRMAFMIEGGWAAKFTASLDASMTLVPEECLAMVKHLWDGPKRCGYAFVSQYTSDAEECDGKLWVTDFQGCAETQALALCAAALKARGL